MRKTFLPLVFLTAFGAAGAALAEDSFGVIKSINQAEMTVTLQDGSTYRFDNNDGNRGAFAGLKPGDSVNIGWSMVGQGRMGEFISPAATSGNTVGVIKSVDRATNTVMLENGKTYSFSKSDKNMSALSGLKAGDRAHIVWSGSGNMMNGQAISPASASTTDSGAIKAIDMAAMVVTLEDGNTYRFDNSEAHRGMFAGLKAGDKVTVTWAEAGHTRVGESIALAE